MHSRQGLLGRCRTLWPLCTQAAIAASLACQFPVARKMLLEVVGGSRSSSQQSRLVSLVESSGRSLGECAPPVGLAQEELAEIYCIVIILGLPTILT